MVGVADGQGAVSLEISGYDCSRADADTVLKSARATAIGVFPVGKVATCWNSFAVA